MKVRNRRSGAVGFVSDEYGARLIASGLYTEAVPVKEDSAEEEAPKPAPKRRGRPPKNKPVIGE